MSALFTGGLFNLLSILRLKKSNNLPIKHYVAILLGLALTAGMSATASAACSGVNLQVGYDFDLGAKTGIAASDAGVCTAGATTAPAGDDYCASNTADASTGDFVIRTNDVGVATLKYTFNAGVKHDNYTIVATIPQTGQAGATSTRAAGLDIATWQSLPSACSGAGSAISNGGRTLTCNLGTVDRTGLGQLTVAVPAAFHVSQRALNNETFALNSSESSSGGSAGACAAQPISTSQALTVSARPKIDIKTEFNQVSSTTLNGVPGYYVDYSVYVDSLDNSTVGSEAVASPLNFKAGLSSDTPTSGVKFIQVFDWWEDTTLLTSTAPAGTPVGNGVTIPLSLAPDVTAPNCSLEFMVSGGACVYSPSTLPQRLSFQTVRYFVPLTDIPASGQINLTNFINSNGGSVAAPISTPPASNSGSSAVVEPINANSALYTLLKTQSGTYSKYTDQYAWYNGTVRPDGSTNDEVAMPGETTANWCVGGECKQYPTKTVESMIFAVSHNIAPWTNTIICDKFDNRGQVLTRRARAAGAAAFAFPSNMPGDVIVAMDYQVKSDVIPQGFTVEVASTGAAGYPSDAQQCGDADAAWVDANTVTDYTPYNLVRVKIPYIESPFVAGDGRVGPVFQFTVPLNAPNGAFIGNQMMLKTDTENFGGTNGWNPQTYDPLTNNGTYEGERFQVVRGLVRTQKEAYDASGNVTSTIGLGGKVTFKLSPSYTAAPGVPAPDATIDVVDVLPIPLTYKLNTAHICTDGTPTGLCTGANNVSLEPNSIVVDGSGRQVLTWRLANVALNSAIPPIFIDAEAPITVASGTVLTNTVTVYSPLVDQSTDAERSASKAVTVDNVAGFYVNKRVSTPLIARNGTYTDYLDIANLKAVAESNVDVIDVLPRVGDPRVPSSAFAGTSFLTGAVTTPAAGSTVYYTNAASGVAPTANASTTGGVSATTLAPDFAIAANAANGWCTVAQFGSAGCPANLAAVTAFRVQIPTIAGNATITINAPMGTAGNVEGDAYTNRFAMKTASITPLFSNDVTTQVKQASLAGKVFLDANLDSTANAGEGGLKAVTVTLCNVATPIPCPAGNTVATTTTLVDGTYEFTDLLPGTYYIRETQPAGYNSAGANAAGSAGGIAATPNAFDGVTLFAGQIATDYNFGEQVPVTILPANPNGTASCAVGTKTLMHTLLAGQTISMVNGANFLDRNAPNNLVQNGSFESPVGQTPQGAGGMSSITLTNWTLSGGGAASYPQVFGSSNIPGLNIDNPAINLHGNQAFYFGNSFIDSAAPALTAPNAAGYWVVPTTQVVNPSTSGAYGTAATPVAIEQAITTTIGKTYRLSFVNGYEAGNANEYVDPGLYGVKVGNYPYVYLADGVGQIGTRTLEFVATTASTIVKFSNWGHIKTTATELALDDVIINDCNVGVSVSGHVFNDTNGLTNTFVDGTAVDGSAAPFTTLTAYLVDNAGNIVSSSNVSATGIYQFNAVAPATGYTIVLSNVAGTTGAATGISTTLPAGWVSIGEVNGNTTTANTETGANIADSKSALFDVASTDIIDRNFGIEQSPVAGTATYVNQPNPGTNVTVAVDAGAFTGTLPTVGTAVGNVQAGSTNATDATAVTGIKITAFPSNVTSFTVNGTTYTAATFPALGLTVTPAQLSNPINVDPVDGAVNVVITYIAIDAAGKESASGTVTLPFGNPGKIDVVKAAGVPKQVGAKTFEIDYSVVVGVAVGSPIVFNVQANDNLKRTYPTASTITVSNYAVANGTGAPTCTPATPTYAGTAAASSMLSGLNDLSAGQSCIITFKATVDFGVNPIPTTTQNNTAYASGVGDNATPNTGYTVPDAGAPTPPAVATTTDVSVTAAPTAGVPGTPPATPVLPAAPGNDAPAGVPTPVSLSQQLTLSGNVFDDFNGNKLQDNPAESAASKPVPTGLNAVLADAAGVVLAVIPVAADGSYSFPASPLTTYSVIITTANPAVGAATVPVTLPANWATTGESLSGTVEVSPATSDSKQSVTTALVSLTNVNFGIEQLPDTNAATAPTQANPGGTVKVPVPTLTGSDPEDGAKGTGSTFVISSLPVLPDGTTSAGLLYYNGVLVTAGQIITNYDPTKLTFDPIDGAITAKFTVASVDAAGKVDPTPATVTMAFTQLTVSGNVFNDANGLGDNLVNGVGANPSSGKLTAFLVDSTGKVLDYALVDAVGGFIIKASPGVGYTVVLSNTLGTPASIGLVPPAASLPAGFVNTGENNDAPTVAGSDGVVNGVSAAFDVGATDVVNRNFGIAQTASLSGIVWRDVDHDRAFTSGEPTVPSFLVEVINAAGVVVKTDTTKADGSYSIIGLTPGVPYSVRFRDPATSNIILGVPTFDHATAGTVLGGSNGGTAQGTSTIDNTGGKLNVVLVAGQNLSNQSLPLDPNGVVYDSVSRTPIQGAVVTLLANGSPVNPLCLVGGVNSLTTGPLGYYEYLLINPAPVVVGLACPGSANYTIDVRPPAGYLPPNAIQGGVSLPAGTLTPAANGSVTTVQTQPSAPAIGQPTTYHLILGITLGGLPGNSTGNITNNHIPLDPAAASGLFVSKVGNKSIAEIGDTVMYTIQAKLSTGSGLTSSLIDNLPAGFRYIPGTATIAKGSGAVTSLADPLPAGNKGPQLTFLMGAINSTDTVTVTYKVRVGVGAMQGDGINRVQGHSGSIVSNTAQYKVKVTGGVFTNDACVAGKVFVDCNNNHIQDAEELGIPGVRMYMEDGTYFISDVEGKYSYCGISPKTHVLKIDSITLPRGSRLTTTSNRNAGDANSLFLDTKNGELIRADFAEGSCSNTVLEQVKARRTQGEVRAPETEKKGGPALKFEGKAPNYPQQGTDSANQPLVKPRGGGGNADSSEMVNDVPVQTLPDASGNTRGNNLRDHQLGNGVAK